MPKPTAQGFWNGYAKANDDIRHTYEHVFYGRQLTGDLTAQEVPGMAKPAPDPITPTPTPEGQGTAAPPHAHADLYTRIWGPTSAQPGTPEPSEGQTPTPDNAPRIEAPKIEPPRQGGDLTPE